MTTAPCPFCAELLAAADGDAMMLTQVGRERDTAVAEVERLRGDLHCCADVGRRMEAERDRLRAVLAETPEVLEACERAWCEDVTEPQDFEMQGRTRALRMKRYRRLLAALRARAEKP